jgi:Rrf2 family transcriptional regulator, cysteine metabolism repressor
VVPPVSAGRIASNVFHGCNSEAHPPCLRALCSIGSLALKVSVKSDYAARAVLGLAKHYGTGESVRVEDLAAEQGIPPNYLVQILIELKSQQIVKSQRGKEGGYLLARAPADITFGDVLRCIHGQVFDSPALNDPRCPIELRNSWKLLQTTLDSTANGINFQELLEKSADKEKMYYI